MNVNHYSLEEFDKALFVPDYIAKLENVIEVKDSSKNLLDNKTVAKISKKYQAFWSKIYDVLDTTSKGDNVKNSVYPIKTNYEKTLSELKSEEIEKENVVKKEKSIDELLIEMQEK